MKSHLIAIKNFKQKLKEKVFQEYRFLGLFFYRKNKTKKIVK